MSAGKLSKELTEMLRVFLAGSIGTNVVEGITYVLLLDNERDAGKIKEYLAIRDEARKCGFGTNELFRAYKLSNGYIFDLDINIAKALTAKITDDFMRENGKTGGIPDFIQNKPEERRRADMEKLAKKCIENYKKGVRTFDVALFSKNSVPRIVVNGTDERGKEVVYKFDAYAIRHWDIEAINAQALMPKGIKIGNIEPCEIIQSKTGVRMTLHLAKM